jgi:uncharacterized membrane protein YphA (DoxX/SURF4 family)
LSNGARISPQATTMELSGVGVPGATVAVGVAAAVAVVVSVAVAVGVDSGVAVLVTAGEVAVGVASGAASPSQAASRLPQARMIAVKRRGRRGIGVA